MDQQALFRKMVVNSLAGLGLMLLVLFVPAGTLAWLQGWVFLALITACSTAVSAWLWRNDRALLAARLEGPLRSSQRARDRMIVLALFAAFLIWLVFMGLDARRLRGSGTPLWAELAGAGLILASFWGFFAVLRANSFAATTVRVQSERAHRVVSQGPYAVVRHPMYAFALLMFLGTPLLLGSLWGLLGLVALVPVLMLRTLGEEQLLFSELAGYREYAARVRYRFVPGVW